MRTLVKVLDTGSVYWYNEYGGEIMIFEYGQKEMEYLCQSDTLLAKVIREAGFIEREVDPDIFASLVKSIIGQQIANAALETVLGRLRKTVGEITPENICALGRDGLRACGMSMRKAENILSLAEKIQIGEINLDTLGDMSDEEVIRCLTSLDGVGVWTAEMTLIFSLGRKNVLSYGDFGIRKGIELLYGEKKLTRAKWREYYKRYSPYVSVASFYLWKVGNGEIEI